MSKKIKYEQLSSGNNCFEVASKGERIRFACCDCGLVHWMAFAREKNGRIGIAVKRNVAATTALRRSKRVRLVEIPTVSVNHK
jgi:hypothetical protein